MTGTRTIGLHDAEREAKLKSTNSKTRNSPKFPNIALMKISAWYKAQGHDVRWWSDNDCQNSIWYDAVYSSKVFEKTPVNPNLPANTVKGGTGYGLYTELPPAIDSIMRPDYSLYPDCDYAVGFTSRGCPNRCSWCCVPVKEGGIRHYASWRDILRPNTPKLWLLDNNILACEHGLQQLREIADEYDAYRQEKRQGTHIRLDLNQGMDARLVTPDIADILARITWNTSIRFSCDQMGQVKAINRVYDLLTARGIPDSRIHIYFLVTHDLHEVVERIDALRSISPKLRIYAQAERNEAKGIVPNATQKHFAGWYVWRGIWRKTRWEDYCAHYGADPYDPTMKRIYKPVDAQKAGV